MRLLINTKYRSYEEEIMDDLAYDGPLLLDALDKLTFINKWLGGNQVTLNGLKKILKNQPKNKVITIIDLGCGSGDILRKVAQYGQKNDYQFQLLGIDANKNTIAYAKELSTTYKNVDFKTIDIFSEEFKTLEYDIVLNTLFFHHFKESELIPFLKLLLQKASLGIVVNDLHRSTWAYYLYKLMCLFFIDNSMVVQDGLTSILRGFKRDELIQISKELSANYTIKWKWAFRFQWILKNQ